MHFPPRFVLASASPRRADLLRQAGFEFDVVPADVDERQRPGEAPEACVVRLADEKAATVAPRAEGRVVLAADTMVLIDGAMLGKPRDRADATAMLTRLSGRTHEVLTGVAVRQGSVRLQGMERTSVTFMALDEATIAWYVDTGEPLDKAGAYGVQGLGSRFVARVDGSYTNVVGLPVPLVATLLASPKLTGF